MHRIELRHLISYKVTDPEYKTASPSNYVVAGRSGTAGACGVHEIRAGIISDWTTKLSKSLFLGELLEIDLRISK
jgi:hypothetical protein